MRNVRTIICGVALLWAAAAINTGHAAVATTSDDEIKRINACMAMSADALAEDADCSDMMKRRNVTVAEMQTMKTCKAMKADVMASDDTCTAMANKHPDIMRPKVQ